MLGWKISVGYDLSSNVFNLSINDLPFLGMPYQAQLILKGPQNIIGGSEIELNGVVVHKGWAQYTADTINEWISENNSQPTTDLAIKTFMSSSSEVVNSVFEGLGFTIDQERGLKSLAI